MTTENINEEQPNANEAPLEEVNETPPSESAEVEKVDGSEAESHEDEKLAEESSKDESEDESSEEESGDESEEAESDEADDAIVDEWYGQLEAADPERAKALVAKFAADESFTAEDYEFVAEAVQLPISTVKYGIALQRQRFKAERAQESAADTSVADAEADFGNLQELLDFAKNHAPAEQYAEWATLSQFAHKKKSNGLARELLADIKEYKDANPVSGGGKPKTLGHLASAQGASDTPQSKEPNSEESKQVAEQPNPQVAELEAQLGRLNNQAIAAIIADSRTEPHVRAVADRIRKQRGSTFF